MMMRGKLHIHSKGDIQYSILWLHMGKFCGKMHFLGVSICLNPPNKIGPSSPTPLLKLPLTNSSLPQCLFPLISLSYLNLCPVYISDQSISLTNLYPWPIYTSDQSLSLTNLYLWPISLSNLSLQSLSFQSISAQSITPPFHLSLNAAVSLSVSSRYLPFYHFQKSNQTNKGNDEPISCLWFIWYKILLFHYK